MSGQQLDYKDVKDEEAIKYAYANLKDVPHVEEYEKMISGMKFDGYIDELKYPRAYRHEKAEDYRNFRIRDFKDMDEYNAARAAYVAEIFGKVGPGCFMEYPFYVDYGFNVSIGDGFYSNFNLTILDCAIVKIGNKVMCGPNVSILTVTHDVDPFKRDESFAEWAKPVTIGNNVWLSTGCTVLPGVTIGDNVVIGAGSVVTRDIPSNCLAVGVPCKVQKFFEPGTIATPDH